jgi:hypothetical protein
MDKLASWPRRVARALIAGLLAWALVMQGVAAASPASVSSLDAVVTDVGHCTDGDSERRQSPGRHISCSCCIPCRSSQLGDIAWVPAALPSSAALWFPTAAPIHADLFLILETPAPSGWISSWSQRAPPRLS